MNVVNFENIRCAYQRGADVLHGVSFGVKAGEVVGLLGKNGAGKTTLLRIAMGMLELQGGSVEVLGMNPRREAVAVKRRVGYVSEEQILPPFLRVGEVLELHRRLFPTWDESMASELLESFQLSLDSRIETLSKGQARQVALLCAVSHLPEVLILDEPAGGLDPLARREFLETAIQLLNEAGSTILFSSHYMSDVERLADRVVLLHEGGVLIDGLLERVSENHSLALIPLSNGLRKETLFALDACLGVRERSEALHAAFSLNPQETRHLLQSSLGIQDANCRNVGLEELFIEIVGGQP